ncbi:MAG TPA: nuclear transport factor 2 family protein [Candidatus Limnocylindria bacterium]
MPELTNEEVARRYFEANMRNDLDVLESLRTPDWQLRWPSTGELVADSAAYRRVHEDYPGGYPAFDQIRIIGSEDRYVVTPANTVLRVSGSGDVWIGHARLAYGDGSVWDGVKLLELRGGRVHRETDFWSPVMEPPAWRRDLTSPLPRAEDPR